MFVPPLTFVYLAPFLYFQGFSRVRPVVEGRVWVIRPDLTRRVRLQNLLTRNKPSRETSGPDPTRPDSTRPDPL